MNTTLINELATEAKIVLTLVSKVKNPNLFKLKAKEATVAIQNLLKEVKGTKFDNIGYQIAVDFNTGQWPRVGNHLTTLFNATK